jgi:hypothetical protein
MGFGEDYLAWRIAALEDGGLRQSHRTPECQAVVVDVLKRKHCMIVLAVVRSVSMVRRLPEVPRKTYLGSVDVKAAEAAFPGKNGKIA